MHAVQGIARLEGDDIVMAVTFQDGARFGRRSAKLGEIQMRRKPKHPQLPGDIDFAPAMHLSYDRVARIILAKDLGRHLFQVPFVSIFDSQYGENVILAVAQRDVGAELNVGARVDRQGNRHREERAVSEPHRVQHALVISLIHESIERREGANRQQLEIAFDAGAYLYEGQGSGVSGLLDEQLLLGTSKSTSSPP